MCGFLVVDCERRKDQNGGSVGSACLQNDALGRRWEKVPPLGLISASRWAATMGWSNSAVCNLVSKDAHETHVVLLGRFGRRGEVDVCPTTELGGSLRLDTYPNPA